MALTNELSIIDVIELVMIGVLFGYAVYRQREYNKLKSIIHQQHQKIKSNRSYINELTKVIDAISGVQSKDWRSNDDEDES